MNKIEKIDLEFINDNYFRNELKKYLKHIFNLKLNIRGILLFGSLARGEAKNNEKHVSDIDLIIICDNLPKDYKKRREKIRELTRSVSSGIQAFWWTSKELEGNVKSKHYLILDAFDEGKILYDPEGFLNDLRDKLFRELKEKNVIKTDLYWRWPVKKFGDRIEY
ncbi:MAG: nucleotidyltransferase domain-containing protein [Promethearchaeota archaeon]